MTVSSDVNQLLTILNKNPHLMNQGAICVNAKGIVREFSAAKYGRNWKKLSLKAIVERIKSGLDKGQIDNLDQCKQLLTLLKTKKVSEDVVNGCLEAIEEKKKKISDCEPISVQFTLGEDDGLKVAIETRRLLIRSVNSGEYLEDYTRLYGDIDVMKHVSHRITKSAQVVKNRMNGTWLKRWKQNNPFSALAVINKKTQAFVGHTMLRAPVGQVTELAYTLAKEHHGQGYGTEVAYAMLYHYAKAASDFHKMRGEKPIKNIVATAWSNNIGSNKILARWMQHDEEKESTEHKELYHSYHLSMQQIAQRDSFQP